MNNNLAPVKIRRILYSTDLSEEARNALAYAVDLANRYGAQLILLHVIDQVPDVVDSWVVGYMDAEEWEQQKAGYEKDSEDQLRTRTRSRTFIRGILDKCREDLRPEVLAEQDFEDEVIVRKGNPAAKILDTAEEKNCDMIVMGSHGRGGFLGAMLGSTAQRVLRRSKIPVFVVRHPDL